MKLSTDTADFLSTLLQLADTGERSTRHVKDWTVHQFHPEFVSAVDSFLSGFRDFVSLKSASYDGEDEMTIDALSDPDAVTRGSFGGNVYLSLSGAGCGFQDDDETEALHAALLEYSGSRYRFEELEHTLAKFKGQIHLAYRTAAFRREYLAKLFTVSAQPATV